MTSRFQDASRVCESGDTMINKRTTARIAVGLAALAIAVLCALTTAAPRAEAAYGDLYGAAPINDGGGPADEAPAIAGNRAFWAGACDRGAFTGVFGSLVSRGGFGSRSTQVRAPMALGTHVSVAAPATPDHCLDWGAASPYKFDSKLWVAGGSPGWRLPAVTQAGAHPDGTSMFGWRRGASDIGFPPGVLIDGSVDNIVVDLPPGFVGNPQAVSECTGEEFRSSPLRCPPESQVGVLRLYIEGAPFGGSNNGTGYDTTYPVYNLQPRPGRAAELGFGYASGERAVTVRLTGKARTNGDYGVTAFVGQIPAALSPLMQTITLWGVPWAAENDIWRAKLGHMENSACKAQQGVTDGGQYYIPPGGLKVLVDQDCRALYDPSWGDIKPFLTNETDCNPAPVVRWSTDAFQHPGPLTADGDPDIGAYPFPASGAPWVEPVGWKTYTSTSPAVAGCEGLGFEPDIEFSPTSDQADGASGLHVGLSVPQNNEPPPGVAHDPGLANDIADGAPGHWRSAAGRATAHLRDTVVTLPEGFSVNPSGATGLTACSDAGIGVRGFDDVNGRVLFNDGDPFNKDAGADGAECPDASKIGTARVDTPLLAEPVLGDVVLGEPKSTDPASGEMFRLFIVVRDAERGLVVKIHGTATADPQTGRISSTFANNPELPFDDLILDIQGGQRGLLALPARCGSPSWSTSLTAWSGSPAVVDGGAFDVGSNCDAGFSPSLVAGSTPRGGRSNATFSFQFSRRDGEQYLRGLTAKLPQGLLASVKDLPLCSNAAADAGACPAGSKIGVLDAKAGSGDPFVLEEKGEVFLTEGYKGGEYGLAVKVRPIAGPFRGQWELSPIIVRQAIHVDRTSAQVTAVSDPFPLIHHGVPLRVREVTVLVNRPGFMLNPSDCTSKQVGATLLSDRGASSNTSSPFQASGCGSLAFEPTLKLALTGKKQTTTGKHPGIKAVVTQQGVPEAGIERAEVRLPKSLALDVNNAHALCEYVDGTKPDLENHCPKGSIVGRARAVSPLLNDPLVGNVYFVKNVRIDPKTGNQIRTLPMIVVALRGEIAVNLKGESDTTKTGKLVNTFANVPDAPVSQFNLNINGGKTGILAVTRTRRSLINICNSGRQVAEADMDGQNGRRHDFDITMAKPCAKKTRKAKKTACKTAKQKAAKTCRRKAKHNKTARRAS
jgi:hypothetical protein